MRRSELARRVAAVYELFFQKRVTRSAAELAYFLTLSFFPILICLHWLVGTLHVGADRMLALLHGILPDSMLFILADYLNYVAGSQSNAMLFAGVIAMMTTSSAAFRSLLGTMDDLYDRRGREGLWGLLVSFACSLIFLLTVYASVLIVLTGSWFLRLLDRAVGVGRMVNSWDWSRFVVLFVFVFLLLWAFYRFVAGREAERRGEVAPGAVFSALSLVAVSVVFSWFIGLSARYSLIYGSLASMIVLMTWIYICGIIIILGAVINLVWSKG